MSKKGGGRRTVAPPLCTPMAGMLGLDCYKQRFLFIFQTTQYLGLGAKNQKKIFSTNSQLCNHQISRLRVNKPYSVIRILEMLEGKL